MMVSRADTASARASVRSWRRGVRLVAGVASRVPVTVAVVLGLWLVGATTGSLPHGPPERLRAVVGTGVSALREGRWWTVLTSVPWCAQLPGYVATSVATAVLLPVAERRLGSARTVATLLVAQVVGVTAGIGVAALLGGGSRWVIRLDDTTMLGPSAAVTGAVLLASAGLGSRWRRRVRLLLLSALAMMALYSGLLGDVLRLLTGLLGLVAGAATFGRRRAAEQSIRPLPSSRSETRVLVALLVALSAVGPLVAALAQTGVGPLAVLRYVFTSPTPAPGTVVQVCADPVALEECAALRARARLFGWGSAVMSVMPVLLLLISAVGLWRGRRAAWVVALVLNVALGLLGLLLAVDVASQLVDRLVLLGSGVHVHAALTVALPALQPLAVAAVLLLTRWRFREPAAPDVLRAAGRSVAVAFVAVAAAFLALGSLLRARFTPQPGFTDLLVEFPGRLLPPVYLGELEPGFLPTTVSARWLFEWVGPAFWAVAGAAALGVFLRDRPVSGEDDRPRLRALAQRGGSTLAWMATWPGNNAWFTPDGRAALAYRVVGGVALSVGGPVGDRDAAPDAIEGFLAHCRERGWTPALYSIDDEVVALVRARGWSDVQVAEETVLPLTGLAFTGKRWQDVRTALNRARRDGTTAVWTTYRTATPVQREQIRAISEEWSAEKGLPEMGFTLGGVAELDDPQVRLLLAVDRRGVIQAATSWLPVSEDGGTVGWTLDFMRRRTDSPGGIMEFLIATAALDAQAEGARYLSLSGAPLARVDDDEQPARGVQRLLDLLAGRLEPVYGFRSLLAFKAKFQPTYRPLYLAYPDPVVLPAIGNALARAYLPDLTPRQLSRLVRAVLT